MFSMTVKDVLDPLSAIVFRKINFSRSEFGSN